LHRLRRVKTSTFSRSVATFEGRWRRVSPQRRRLRQLANEKRFFFGSSASRRFENSTLRVLPALEEPCIDMSTTTSDVRCRLAGTTAPRLRSRLAARNLTHLIQLRETALTRWARNLDCNLFKAATSISKRLHRYRALARCASHYDRDFGAETSTALHTLSPSAFAGRLSGRYRRTLSG
jgi:hypothetical protein